MGRRSGPQRWAQQVTPLGLHILHPYHHARHIVRLRRGAPEGGHGVREPVEGGLCGKGVQAGLADGGGGAVIAEQLASAIVSLGDRASGGPLSTLQFFTLADAVIG